MPSRNDAAAASTVRRRRTDSPRARCVDAAIDEWRDRLLALGGQSPLADIELLGSAAIDLTAAHPSGVAQLFAGRPTLLSNLVREDVSLATARRRARTLLARADDLAQRYGVAPTYLAIGVATWTEPGTDAVPDGDPQAAEGERAAEAAASAADASAAEAAASAADASAPEVADEPASAPASDAPDAVEPAEPSAAATSGTPSARVVRAPVLLRPVRLAARSETEVEILLEPSVEINPVLVRALRAAGVELDTAALARETMREYGFTPRHVLQRLRAIGEDVLADFRHADHLVLGPFLHPGQVLAEDLETRREELAEHDVVAALAGDADAAGALQGPLPSFVPGDRAPDVERGVGDLDPSQQHALAAASAGLHLFVDAPPGSDATATVAALLADAAAAGRHVLYVSGTRRSGHEVSEVIEAAGLGDLLLDLSADSQWRPSAGARLAGGATVVPVQRDGAIVRRRRAELVDARSRLAAYIAALHRVREPWGVSAYDALQSLAALTSARISPRTTVRLDGSALRALDGAARDEARAALERAAHAGAFAVRPEDTPWYGAAISDPESAQEAATKVARLSEHGLPALRRRIHDVAVQTGLDRARTLRAWGEQLAVLDGVREVLDVFQPMVFERSAADLVAATASRQWRAANGIEMRWGVRRRLRRQARDMLRPGRPMADLHGALVHVQSQHQIWGRHCTAGGWPRLPEGLAQCVAEYRAIAADVVSLDPVLASTQDGGRLADVPLTDLEARFRRLAADREALGSLPARTRAFVELRALGLGDLVRDIVDRDVPPELVGPELELSWWSSVFEDILRADPALTGHDGVTLGALADHLRELDVVQVDSLPALVSEAVAAYRDRVLQEVPDPGSRLVELAGGQVADVRAAVADLGPLAGALRPCWLVSATQVPHLVPPGMTVDVVVLDAAQHLPVEQAVAAISRARQVVVVGDSRRVALEAPGGPVGIVGALARLLPRVTLSADRVVREAGLMAFLGEHGYADVVRPVPTPATRPCVRLDVVEGFGLPIPGLDIVESPQSEVDHVVDLVIDHALARPDESLAVLTPSERHADRVREAVRAAVADSPAVGEFFATDRWEPFVVLDLDSAAGVRRDAVVLSLGLGKTPHGRIMHRFGRLSDPDGPGLLIDAIDACRRRLTVVSCFGPGELDTWRLRTPGPALLADLLQAAESGASLPASIPAEGEPDRLLVDLAHRLWQLGLTVVPRYGVPGGVRIPLVIGHPDLPDEHLLAVLTDDADYVRQQSLRIRDRHDVQRLLDRGWAVHMAFSTAVFMDPQAEAEQILAKVLAVLPERSQERAEQAPRVRVGAVPPGPARPAVVPLDPDVLPAGPDLLVPEVLEDPEGLDIPDDAFALPVATEPAAGDDAAEGEEAGGEEAEDEAADHARVAGAVGDERAGAVGGDTRDVGGDPRDGPSASAQP